jgi:hypothetical protein
MHPPGGFDGTLEKWSTLGIYAKINLVHHLSQKYSCILFDRRECGKSGGRIEPVTWARYAAQGKGLLVLALAATAPNVVLSMILFWPVGGARYRINNQRRFAEHLAYVREHGLRGVVSLITTEDKSFGAAPRVGAWAAGIRSDCAELTWGKIPKSTHKS